MMRNWEDIAAASPAETLFFFYCELMYRIFTIHQFVLICTAEIDRFIAHAQIVLSRLTGSCHASVTSQRRFDTVFMSRDLTV